MIPSTSIWRTALCVLFIFSGISGIGKYSAWTILVCLAIGAALIPWNSFRRVKKEKPEKVKVIQAKATEAAAESPEEVARSVALLGPTCKYSYEHVSLYRPEDVDPMPPLGASLMLEREADNPYDPEAIRAVKWSKDGVKVYGYMNKGKLRDMVSDFLDRGETILTKVTRADDKLEIWIGMP